MEAALDRGEVAVRGRELGGERGQALTEYAVGLIVLIPICIYLFNPDNAVFIGIRIFFDDTCTLILLPGP